jgi:hypothetical protein
MRSILVAMMKSFSCSPLIFLVCSETVALPPTEADICQESWRFPAQRKRELLSFWAHEVLRADTAFHTCL